MSEAPEAFSTSEWHTVLGAPLEMYLALLGADGGVESYADEERAFCEWLERTKDELPSGSWMQIAFADATRPTSAQAHGAATRTGDELQEELSELLELLRLRVGAGEAERFGELLIRLAKHVASATHGPSGIGPRVTKNEADLIWRMRQALGLMRTLHP